MKKIITLLIIAAVVVGLGYLISGMVSKDNSGSTGNNENQKNDVTFKPVNLKDADTAEKKLPVGLPSDIPVETDIVTQSYSANYENPKAEELSVTFISTKTVDQKYAEYKNYMTENEYEFSEFSDAKTGVRAIYGSKDNNDLSVSVSKTGNNTQVLVVYVKR